MKLEDGLESPTMRRTVGSILEASADHCVEITADTIVFRDLTLRNVG
jgi:hypothetical protein